MRHSAYLAGSRDALPQGKIADQIDHEQA